MFYINTDTATTLIYTLSLHAALPISLERILAGIVVLPEHRDLAVREFVQDVFGVDPPLALVVRLPAHGDRKSTRLNSSHLVISYAVFCLKKKKIKQKNAQLS